MVLIEVEGDPPNKQQAAYKRNVTQLRQELSATQKKELNSEIVKTPVSIEINLYSSKLRYIRKGHDNTYIGDLDNLLSGILDELRGRIIDDDAQVMEITAKKNIVDNSEKTRYTILIQ
jgi:Holliday junction resolvase RusA-like endonuclease